MSDTLSLKVNLIIYLQDRFLKKGYIMKPETRTGNQGPLTHYFFDFPE